MAWLNVSRATIRNWRRENPPAPFRRHGIFPHTWEVCPLELELWLARRALRHCSVLHRVALDSASAAADAPLAAAVRR